MWTWTRSPTSFVSARPIILTCSSVFTLSGVVINTMAKGSLAGRERFFQLILPSLREVRVETWGQQPWGNAATGSFSGLLIANFLIWLPRNSSTHSGSPTSISNPDYSPNTTTVLSGLGIPKLRLTLPELCHVDDKNKLAHHFFQF